MGDMLSAANLIILLMAAFSGVYKFGKLEQKVVDLQKEVEKLNGHLNGGEF